MQAKREGGSKSRLPGASTISEKAVPLAQIVTTSWGRCSPGFRPLPGPWHFPFGRQL